MTVLPRLTETQCQATIVATARRFGWLVYHNRAGKRSVQGHVGFPDLVLVHAGARRTLFVELKRHPNELTPEQIAWGRVLQAAGESYRVVRVPEELDTFVRFLIETSRPVVTVIMHDPFAMDGES